MRHFLGSLLRATAIVLFLFLVIPFAVCAVVTWGQTGPAVLSGIISVAIAAVCVYCYRRGGVLLLQARLSRGNVMSGTGGNIFSPSQQYEFHWQQSRAGGVCRSSLLLNDRMIWESDHVGIDSALVSDGGIVVAGRDMPGRGAQFWAFGLKGEILKQAFFSGYLHAIRLLKDGVTVCISYNGSNTKNGGERVFLLRLDTLEAHAITTPASQLDDFGQIQEVHFLKNGIELIDDYGMTVKTTKSGKILNVIPPQ